MFVVRGFLGWDFLSMVLRLGEGQDLCCDLGSMDFKRKFFRRFWEGQEFLESKFPLGFKLRITGSPYCDSVRGIFRVWNFGCGLVRGFRGRGFRGFRPVCQIILI